MPEGTSGIAADRRAVFEREAEEKGLFRGDKVQVGARLPAALVAEAKRLSGIEGTTDLLTYALMKVALEDDFGRRLMARRGTVPKGTLFAG